MPFVKEIYNLQSTKDKAIILNNVKEKCKKICEIISVNPISKVTYVNENYPTLMIQDKGKIESDF